ncbi:MAG: hypothetical protein ACHBN1_26550 [Heteroscytonema crispum UTEX LB 1556]
MGDFYTDNTLPSIYQGSLFIADASQGTVSHAQCPLPSTKGE